MLLVLHVQLAAAKGEEREGREEVMSHDLVSGI